MIIDDASDLRPGDSIRVAERGGTPYTFTVPADAQIQVFQTHVEVWEGNAAKTFKRGPLRLLGRARVADLLRPLAEAGQVTLFVARLTQVVRSLDEDDERVAAFRTALIDLQAERADSIFPNGETDPDRVEKMVAMTEAAVVLGTA